MAFNKLFPIYHARFTYRPETETFSAEMSDFGRNDGILFQTLYDDACDAGFVMQGKEHLIHFYLNIEFRDAEWEIAYWEYRICAEDARKYNLSDKIKVVIFND